MSMKRKLHDIVFNTNCKFRQAFDTFIVLLIMISTFSVALSSVKSYQIHYGSIFNILEWILTLLFTIEYIPVSIYWAIVTLTTVGYGDISSRTPLGKLIASMVMILSYCIIAVPTGLVNVDLSKNLSQSKSK